MIRIEQRMEDIEPLDIDLEALLQFGMEMKDSCPRHHLDHFISMT